MLRDRQFNLPVTDLFEISIPSARLYVNKQEGTSYAQRRSHCYLKASRKTPEDNFWGGGLAEITLVDPLVASALDGA